MIIKVCGMTRAENIRQVEALGPDWMGFIFHPGSKRYVAAPPGYMPRRTHRVGVFVDAPIAEILTKAEEFGLNIVQLHGSESPEYCAELKKSGIGVIKAIHVGSAADLNNLNYAVDYLLFETPTAGYGGSGKQFDWSLLDCYAGNVPFILSGGIGPEDAEAICAISHPLFAGIDLNSRFESAPGIKNPELLALFIEKLKQYESHK